MILKFENEDDELFVIDATAVTGVAIQKWSTLRAYLHGKDPQIPKYYE
jgi:hypothetical protein